MPTIVQACFALFWVFNIAYNIIDNFVVVFIIMMAVGGLWGSEYTNFLYLANATFEELPCDMKLKMIERELTVNLLLAATDLGNLFAVVLTFVLKANIAPQLLYENPG